MSERPTCRCHGVAMYRQNDHRPGRRSGWRCAVRKRAAVKRWDERYPEKKKARNDRRILVGESGYFGSAATVEQAEQIKAKARQLLAEFNSTQKEARIAAGS